MSGTGVPAPRTYIVEFAQDRSEAGSIASFRYLYEAMAFVELLTNAGWFVQPIGWRTEQ